MQRLAYLAGSSSRVVRAIAVNHLKNDRSLFEQGIKLCNANNFILQRCLATKSKGTGNAGEIDPHNDLYKPSTAKEETHVPNDLENHHQPTETINITVNTRLKSSGKVWSTQNPDGVHIAPLGRDKSTTFVPKSGENVLQNHETTVYSTHGELNIADPFKTHTLQPEVTLAKLAEAAAASAFETFAPDTPSTPAPGTEAVFAPKISSSDVYSNTSSPTAHFEATVSSSSSSSSKGPLKYEIAAKGKVFGGQDTSADTKKHPKEDPFRLGEKEKPRQAK